MLVTCLTQFSVTFNICGYDVSYLISLGFIACDILSACHVSAANFTKYRIVLTSGATTKHQQRVP